MAFCGGGCERGMGFKVRGSGFGDEYVAKNWKYSLKDVEEMEVCQTRVYRVQVKTQPIQDGLDTALRCIFSTFFHWTLKVTLVGVELN